MTREADIAAELLAHMIARLAEAENTSALLFARVQELERQATETPEAEEAAP